MRNWSETVTYSSSGVAHPTSLDQLCEVLATNRRVRALGSRHSFNLGVDTSGLHVSLDQMPRTVEVHGSEVTCGGGMTHAELSRTLAPHGLALPNLASLPHISVAGAIQTGTHGSGIDNAALSSGVTALGLVDAAGEQRTLDRGDRDFHAVVVGLGAFGVIHSVTQRCVPEFSVAQTVFEHLSWERLLPRLSEVLGSAYSVSLFTRFDAETIPQVWIKARAGDEPGLDLVTLGATAATRVLHPLPETPSDNVTDQLGSPGPSYERLPHFRSEFQPGRGDEIQSEYLVDIERGAEAVERLRRIGHRVGPLLHMAEIRCVAADDAWLSPSSGRTSIALHFTWRRRPAAVLEVLPHIEDALLPLGARPHWGKAFTLGHADLVEVYPRLLDFRAVVERWDPTGTFHNDFLGTVLGRREGSS